jgi:hypothetical protein
MKGSFFDKIGYNFIEGKGLLIVVVILFSSTSFILGFFAGKKMSVSDSAAPQAKKAELTVIEARAARPAVPTPQPAPPQPPTPQPAAPQPPTPEAAAVKPQEESPAGKDIKTYDLVKPAEQPQQAEPVRPPPQPAPEPAKAPSEALSSKPPAKDVLTPAAIPKGRNASSQEVAVHASKESKTAVKQQKTAKQVPKTYSDNTEKYFIQIGAFKSLSEAMRLQEELKMKGFDSNISKNPVNDGVTLFKVRLGNNYTKAEASRIMARLNKKGINGFMRETQR